MDENNNVVIRVPEQQFIRGEDGYSPVVTIEEIEHGHSVNITDREHQEGQSFDVMDGETGTAGADGVTYTPSVDADGNISWTNDGDLPNPQTRNIKGPQGEPGINLYNTQADLPDAITQPDGTLALVLSHSIFGDYALLEDDGWAWEYKGRLRGPQGPPGEVTQAEFDELSGDVADLTGAVSATNSADNLFDKNASGIVAGKYIREDGSIGNSGVGSVSNYIPVIPGSTLAIYPVVTYENWYCNYCANTQGRTIKNTVTLYNIDTLDIPNDVYFIRITFETARIDDVYITYKNTNTISVENAHELDSVEAGIENHYASTESIDLWQQGTLDGDGHTQSNSTRIVSGALYAFDGLIVPESGYEVMAGVYDKNSNYLGVFNGTDTYVSTPVYFDTFLPVYMIPENYQLRIVLRAKDSAAITPAENWNKAYIVKYHLNKFLRLPIKQKAQNINGKGHCAFPGMCYFAGKMLISYRFSKSHYPPTESSDWGGAQIDTVTNGMVVKHELTLTSASLNDWMNDPEQGNYPPTAPRIQGELGNVYMGVSNDGNYLVLSSWTTIWVGSARKFENVLICLDRDLAIQGVQVIEPPAEGLQHKFWGFPLFTPTNHLIIAGYTLTGDTTGAYEVRIWRSEQAFTNNVYGLTMQLKGLITDDQYAGETCLGYIGNKLAAIMRRQGAGTTAGNSTFLKLSSDLEGETDFTGNDFSAGMIVHCPTLLPRSDGNKLFFVGAKRNGSKRETVLGYYEITGDTAEIKEIRGIDDVNYNYGGYAGFVSDGDEKFWVVYYLEDTSPDLSEGHTGLFLKYVNAREVLPTLNNSKGAIAELYSEVDGLKSAINDPVTGLDTKAPVIIDTASGAIASFEDGADGMPLKSLTVNIEPVQDLHGQSSPYPAGGGKNKLQVTAVASDVSGVTITVNDDGSIKLVGTATASVTFVLNYNLSLESASWIFSGEGFGSMTGTDGGVFAASGTSDTPDVINNKRDGDFSFSGTVGRIWLYFNSGTVLNNTLKLMIRPSSIADNTWAPYSNICPISGRTGANVTRTGKNLANPKLYSGGAYDPTIGSIWNLVESSVQLSDIGNGQFSIDLGSWAFRVFIFDLLEGQSYCFNCIFSGENIATSYGYLDENYKVLTKYNETGSNIPKAVMFTGTSERRKAYVGFAPRSSAQTVMLTGLQLELGSTATAYEPYQGNTYPISWQTEAGTVYGGTLDVTSGVLTVDRAMVDLGTLTWTKESNHFYSNVLSAAKPPVNNTVPAKIVCSAYKNASAYSVTQEQENGTTGLNNSKRLYIFNDAYTDSASLTTALSGVQLVYELATPIEITLTPTQIDTLLGTNNIWADCGSVDVDYPADTKLYIQKVNKPTDDDMTADAQIASGKYFIIGNNLYLSTTVIPAGDAIIPGTNCTKTDLAAALNALNA